MGNEIVQGEVAAPVARNVARAGQAVGGMWSIPNNLRVCDGLVCGKLVALRNRNES